LISEAARLNICKTGQQINERSEQRNDENCTVRLTMFGVMEAETRESTEQKKENRDKQMGLIDRLNQKDCE
jgi:hypothetical protein